MLTGGTEDAFDEQRQPLIESLPILAASSRRDERQLALELGNMLMNRDFEMRAGLALDYATLLEPIFARSDEITDAMGHHHMMGVVYLQNLQLEDAARHFEISRRLLAEQGVAGGANDSLPTWHGRLRELMGDYAEAESLMKAGYAMERHNDAGGSRVNDWCLANYARFLVDTGRATEGLALAERGGPLASASIRAELPGSLRSLLAQAHALARLGRGEEALSKAEHAQRLLMDIEPEPTRPPLPAVVESLLTLGRASEAMEVLDREEPRMAQGRASIIARLLAEYQIRALVALERPREARAYLESRRTILAPRNGGPAEQARLDWLDAGVALREGRPSEARRALAEGLRRLDLAVPDAQIYVREWRARLQDRMGDAALALGDDAGARAAYESAMSGYEKTVDPKFSMAMARVAQQLAKLALRRGDASSASHLQAQADAVVARHPGQRGWGA